MSANHAEGRRRARTLRKFGLIQPGPAACATTDAAWGEKRFLNLQSQAILPLDGRPLWEVVWGMSARDKPAG